MTGITIVPFAEKDRSELTDLYNRVRTETFTWLNKEVILQSSFTESTEGEMIFVARMQDTIIGFISAWKSDNFIHNLYVDVQHQKKGIGKQLFKEMATELARPITLKCLKQNKTALYFYHRLGFISTSEGISNEGEYVLLKLDS